MNEYAGQHTFVICAYKSSPYMDACVKSLIEQESPSAVIISTSTPTPETEQVAKKYGVPLVVNEDARGHIADFCFAYGLADTKYVTLAHQDDVYLPDFSKEIVTAMQRYDDAIIGFSGCKELRGDEIVETNRILKVKAMLNAPLSVRAFNGSRFVRNRLLSLGNAIVAPSVTYNKDLVETPIYPSELKANIDWYTWAELAKRKGRFMYVKTPLLLRRIHSLSTTTDAIKNNIMAEENYLMFRRFWCAPIAKLLNRIYAVSEDDAK